MSGETISESSARQILREHSIERGIDDPRSCAEIVVQLGLAPLVGIEPAGSARMVDNQPLATTEPTAEITVPGRRAVQAMFRGHCSRLRYNDPQ